MDTLAVRLTVPLAVSELDFDKQNNKQKSVRPAWRTKQKARTKSGLLLKDWRLPSLAEAIQPLPSAMQRLTAVFGMGTGRTTAVLPPKTLNLNDGHADKNQPNHRKQALKTVKERHARSLKTTYRGQLEQFASY